MSKNFVLVQYGNQTRKIQGDPSRKKYKTLVNQICDKFDIDFEIAIQVYDRDNNQYFAIDSSEVREIQNGGKIKVSRAKGPRSTPKKGGKKGSPMKPPGVPPQSKEDDAKRGAWRKGSKCEIYSETERQWIVGNIIKVYMDSEGEWLVIRYAAARTKEIQRFSNYIRPIQPAKKAKKKAEKKKESPKKEKKEPKPPKVVKVTTQSKYKRMKRVPTKEEVPENVVEFKGNNGHIKQYIDRACMLLRGPKEVPEEEVKAEDDEKKDTMGPSKKYDVVHLYGVGRAMAHVVSAAEFVKRIVPGLYQQTKMEVQEIVDVYEPTESGLKNVEVSRSITGIRVTLAVHEKDVDSASSGFQAPEVHEDGFGVIEYEYPDEKKAKKSKNKGRKKGGRAGGK